MYVYIYIRYIGGSTLTLRYGVDETHGRAGLGTGTTGLRSLDGDHVVFMSVRHSGFAVCQLPGHFDRGDAIIAGGQILALDKRFCCAITRQVRYKIVLKIQHAGICVHCYCWTLFLRLRRQRNHLFLNKFTGANQV